MDKKPGILVVSHGSRDHTWVKVVDDAVYAAKQRWTGQAVDEQERGKRKATPVYAAYMELVEGRLIQDGVNTLEHEGVTDIYVMPLFVSKGSSHVEEIRQSFGLQPISEFIGDLDPLELAAAIHFDEPIGAEPEIVQILEEQILALARSTEIFVVSSTDSAEEFIVSSTDEHTLQTEAESVHAMTNQNVRVHAQSASGPVAVLLLGHGSSMPFFFEQWEDGMMRIAEALRQRLPLEISYAPLLPEGSRAALQQRLDSGQQVMVIPLFISPGYFTQRIIPSRLEGLSYVYSGETLLPHPLMSNLLCRRFSSYALF